MDPISQFQQQLSAPAYSVLGQFWPIVLFAVLAVAGYFFLHLAGGADFPEGR